MKYYLIYIYFTTLNPTPSPAPTNIKIKKKDKENFFGHKNFFAGNIRETGARSLCSSYVAYI